MQYCVSIIIFAILLTSSACSTTIRVRDISDKKWDDLINNEKGIPFRMLEPHTVRVFQKQKDGTYKAVGDPLHVSLPNPQTLYSVNYTSEYFSDNTFNLVLREDSSLISMGSTEQLKADEAIAAFGEQSTGIAEAAINFDRTRLTREVEEKELEARRLNAEKQLIEARRNLRETREGEPDAAVPDSQ